MGMQELASAHFCSLHAHPQCGAIGAHCKGDAQAHTAAVAEPSSLCLVPPPPDSYLCSMNCIPYMCYHVAACCSKLPSSRSSCPQSHSPYSPPPLPATIPWHRVSSQARSSCVQYHHKQPSAAVTMLGPEITDSSRLVFWLASCAHLKHAAVCWDAKQRWQVLGERPAHSAGAVNQPLTQPLPAAAMHNIVMQASSIRSSQEAQCKLDCLTFTSQHSACSSEHGAV